VIDEDVSVGGTTGGGKSNIMPKLLAEAELAGMTPIVITDTRNLRDFEDLVLVEDEVHDLFADEGVRERLARLIRQSRSTAMPELEERS
jgi:hypothetical protein